MAHLKGEFLLGIEMSLSPAKNIYLTAVTAPVTHRGILIVKIENSRTQLPIIPSEALSVPRFNLGSSLIICW